MKKLLLIVLITLLVVSFMDAQVRRDTTKVGHLLVKGWAKVDSTLRVSRMASFRDHVDLYQNTGTSPVPWITYTDITNVDTLALLMKTGTFSGLKLRTAGGGSLYFEKQVAEGQAEEEGAIRVIKDTVSFWNGTSWMKVLFRGATNKQSLSWSTSDGLWKPMNIDTGAGGGGGGLSAIKYGATTYETVDTLTFDATDFTITQINSGHLDIDVAANMARKNGTNTWTGVNTFQNGIVFDKVTGTLTAPFSILAGRDSGTVTRLDADRLDGQHGTYYTTASNLTGTLADARLSANVPLLNAANAFTAQQTATISTAGVTTLAAQNNGAGTGISGTGGSVGVTGISTSGTGGQFTSTSGSALTATVGGTERMRVNSSGVSATALTLTTPLGISSGGTGVTTAPSAGSILYSTGSGFAGASGTYGRFLLSGGLSAPYYFDLWSGDNTWNASSISRFNGRVEFRNYAMSSVPIKVFNLVATPTDTSQIFVHEDNNGITIEPGKIVFQKFSSDTIAYKAGQSSVTSGTLGVSPFGNDTLYYEGTSGRTKFYMKEMPTAGYAYVSNGVAMTPTAIVSGAADSGHTMRMGRTGSFETGPVTLASEWADTMSTRAYARSVVVAGGSPTGAAGGDLTGTYPNPSIANNAIDSNQIIASSLSITDFDPQYVVDITRFRDTLTGLAFDTVGRAAYKVLKLNATGTKITLQDDAGGTTAAPVDPSYITLGTNGTLTNERPLSVTAPLTLVDNGPGVGIVLGSSGGGGGGANGGGDAQFAAGAYRQIVTYTGLNSYDRVTVTPALNPTWFDFYGSEYRADTLAGLVDSVVYAVRPDTNRFLVWRKTASVNPNWFQYNVFDGALAAPTNTAASKLSSSSMRVTWTSPANSQTATTRPIDSILVMWTDTGYASTKALAKFKQTQHRDSTGYTITGWSGDLAYVSIASYTYADELSSQSASTQDTCLMSGGASYTPLNEGSVAGWWDAQSTHLTPQSDSTQITVWDDYSGNNYDFIQVTSPSTFRSGYYRTNIFGSLPAVEFRQALPGVMAADSVSKEIRGTRIPWTIVWWSKNISALTATYEGQWSMAGGPMTGADDWYISLRNYVVGGDSILFFRERGTGGSSDTINRTWNLDNYSQNLVTPKMWTLIHDGDSLKLYANTTLLGSVLTDTIGDWQNWKSFSLGAMRTPIGGQAQYPGNFHIGEIVVYKKELDLDAITRLYNYMNGRWNP